MYCTDLCNLAEPATRCENCINFELLNPQYSTDIFHYRGSKNRNKEREAAYNSSKRSQAAELSSAQLTDRSDREENFHISDETEQCNCESNTLGKENRLIKRGADWRRNNFFICASKCYKSALAFRVQSLGSRV